MHKSHLSVVSVETIELYTLFIKLITQQLFFSVIKNTEILTLKIFRYI
jgi:hypothetical protein